LPRPWPSAPATPSTPTRSCWVRDATLILSASLCSLSLLSFSCFWGVAAGGPVHRSSGTVDANQELLGWGSPT
jgi:hypothetical protein